MKIRPLLNLERVIIEIIKDLVLVLLVLFLNLLEEEAEALFVKIVIVTKKLFDYLTKVGTPFVKRRVILSKIIPRRNISIANATIALLLLLIIIWFTRMDRRF